MQNSFRPSGWLLDVRFPWRSVLPFVWVGLSQHFRISWIFQGASWAFVVLVVAYLALSMWVIQPRLVIILLVLLKKGSTDRLAKIQKSVVDSFVEFFGMFAAFLRSFPTIRSVSALRIRFFSLRSRSVSGERPHFLKISSFSLPLTLSMLVFSGCLLIRLMLLNEVSNEWPVGDSSRVRLPRCVWSVRCGAVVRSSFNELRNASDSSVKIK